jgi:uncharacterized phage protein (TIGR02216 family)
METPQAAPPPSFAEASEGPPPHDVGRKTPWAEMMRTALALGVGPEAFWRLSLREWRMLTARPAASAPMGRGALERMAEAWPD